MNKNQLIEKIAIGADITKSSAGKALDAMTLTITEELASGGQVSLVGFGSFTIKERAAREGRNPQTGEKISIAATKVPSIKFGKQIKDAEIVENKAVLKLK